MKPTSLKKQPGATSRLLQTGWISGMAHHDSSAVALWTPEGAERALMLSRMVKNFRIRTFSDLAAFDRGCHGEAAGTPVGPGVAGFWRYILAELGVGRDLNTIYEILRLIAASSR